MSLMASPSSSKPSNYKFKIFSSFHGPDVRKTFLSHLREQFQGNGITMFDDEKIKRGGDLSPSLKEAIKESRISIVILSKKYASSSWCLDELVEIMKRKKAMKQIVMTVFYGVEPSDVRKHIGEFGIAFDETCAVKTDNERQKWSKALTDVSNIAGEDFKKWDNEANMIKKIARDVSDKLNATPSRDFEDMVGLEVHLKKIQSLLQLDYEDEAMIFGISGPAGIGKTTIARALLSRLSDRFQLTCFMDLSGTDHSGFQDYGQQLRLQEQLLSKVLNQDGTRICHLGVLQERLNDLRVLIILDDVNDVKQLKALAKETTWFGPGSRIVVTTENKDFLQQRGISNTYHVGFPSRKTALEILRRYAFEQSFPPHGFEELAESITGLCGNLPLGLCVMGSSLFGKKQDEWECVMRRLGTNPGREIDDVLRVGYERLHENDQMLFLHIAIFFNHKDCGLVEAMLGDDGNLDVKNWLKFLVNKSLIEINPTGEIVMHKLLQQVGRQAIQRQEPWKRQIIINSDEICDILQYEKGTSSVFGISFDTSGISEVTISNGALKRMPNLRFLRVYKSRCDGNYRMLIPKEMEFPPRLRLLHWEAYPSKCLPPTFNPECLVELKMRESQLEHLWRGTQPLKNLKVMDLFASKNLKELPDFSNATNLEKLNLNYCESLVEIPSSFPHLHKLWWMDVSNCINLQVIPAHINLASLGGPKLRDIRVIPMYVKNEVIHKTDVHASIMWSLNLRFLDMSYTGKLKGLTHLPKSVTYLNLSYSGIERLPDCIKDLHQLYELDLSGCTRLASLPELPGSLGSVKANDCESLETVFCPLNTPKADLNFTNCFKLGQQARKGIIQRSFLVREVDLEFDQRDKGKPLTTRIDGTSLLPGREVPAEFDHIAKGNSLTICSDSNPYLDFAVCVVISPNQQFTTMSECSELLCRIHRDEALPFQDEVYVEGVSKWQREHIFIFQFRVHIDPSEAGTEMKLEFSSESLDLDIIECGVKILTPVDVMEGYNHYRCRVLREADYETDGRENNGGSGDEDDDRNLNVRYRVLRDADYEPDEWKNNGGSGDEVDGKNYMCSRESGERSQESESESNDDEGYKSEPGEASEESESESDDDEGYNSEHREASEGYPDGDKESVSRKRPRKTTDHQLEDYSNLLKYILLILLVLLLILVLLFMSLRIFVLQGKIM